MLVRSVATTAVALLAAVPVVAQTRYPLKGDSVAIYNLVGELRVEPGSGGDVVVQVTRGGEDSAKLDVQTGPVRGRESLRVLYPADVIVVPDWGRGSNTTLRVRDDGTFGDDNDHRRHGWFGEGREVRITGRGHDGLEASADLLVSVPAGKGVALYLGVGKTLVSNVNGAIRVSVASADVAADRTSGSLRIATGSGDVDVRSANGDVKLETGSGEITLAGMTGPHLKVETGSGNIMLTDAQAPDLQAETGSGDIEATNAEGDDMSFGTGSGDVRVSLATAFQSLHIETGSGNVTVTVPATLGAQVDLDTGSGDIDLGGLTLQVRHIEHDHIVGTMGDGKARLSVETGSGDVHLQKL